MWCCSNALRIQTSSFRRKPESTLLFITSRTMESGLRRNDGVVTRIARVRMRGR